jgi:replicative DNA helicase
LTDQIPQSVDAEREVLSSILDSVPVVRSVAATGLQPEHFYFDNHRAIFRAQRAVARSGHHADELATWAALESMGLSDQVDRNYLAQMVGSSTAAFNVRTHALRIIELASRRVKIEGAHKILEGAKQKEAERSEELIRDGLELVATDYSLEAEATTPEELADDFFTFLDDEEPAELFELPWSQLNKCVLGGYRRKQSSVLAGHSGVGKSLILDQTLTAFHRQEKTTGIFLTEMSKRERTARYVTGVTGIPTERLLRKDLSKEEYGRVVKVLPHIPFHLFEANGWSHEKIAERITFSGLDVAAVDHVTRLPGFEKTETASAAIGRLTEVAVRADLHLILVAQLNKNRMVNGKLPRPTRFDLRQTSQLIDDAHQILFLHRNTDDDNNFLSTGEIYFDKVRNGMKGGIKVAFAPRYLTFEPTEPEPQGEQTTLPTGKETQHDREPIPA